MVKELILLGVGWSLWCFLHSALITPAANARFARWLGRGGRWSRLLYNLFSLLTLVPLVLFTRGLPYPAVLRWHGPWVLVPAALWSAAAGLFWAGMRVYPLGEFLGLRQLGHREQGEPAAEPVLEHSGILQVVRHPWYLAVLLLLWGRNLAPQDFLVSGLLSVYLVIGACLEERKLLRIFGAAYRSYQREVSMFFPWRWLTRQCGRGRGGQSGFLR